MPLPPASRSSTARAISAASSAQPLIGFLKTHTGTLNSGLYLIAGCMIASSILIFRLAPAPSSACKPQEEPI
jgi:hypothetical protein